MTTTPSPRSALLACVGAFSKRDAGALIELADEMALFEIPVLKPDRLYGRDEIR